MIVTFISQCEKKSLKRTRRILDAFANRIGDNTWQTAITEDGLSMVKTLLKASATRTTAVSCHRVRSRQRTELVWIVGNRRKFNELGIVPVNWTRQNILYSSYRKDWQHLDAMMIVATLSALLHDIGKSTIGFQHKLFKHSKLGDPYRHEWISLKLLLWLAKDCQTDAEVFNRLQTLDEFLSAHQPTLADLKDHIEQSEFDQLPPVTQWIAWLVVTHHRLPALKGYFFDPKQKQKLLTPNHRDFTRTTEKYYQKYLKPLDYWVKNPKSFNEMSTDKLDEFFSFDSLVIHSPAWQKQIKRYAKKAEQDVTLQHMAKNATPIADPFLLMLSRLSLMVADHNYSSLNDSPRRIQGSPEWADKLLANTDPKTGQGKQALDEHLLGVARFTAQFCRSLPILHENLPRLSDHQPLLKNTDPKSMFAWQNKAFKLALTQSDTSQTHGFFGVNMASTGYGKTLGNARIMTAIADPKKGTRLTIALGLRVLTLQTGLSFRQNLHLTDKQLAILVGGQAQKTLFELNAQNDIDEQVKGSAKDDAKDTIKDKADDANTDNNQWQAFGSESMQDLVDDYVDGDDYDDILDELHLDTVIENPTARKLIGAPIVTCTIDHLMQASECKRGGKYIAPLLRLLSSDLILDEPDDFDHNDLPALSRLVHLAGLFGSRVLLSSATLPPDMVSGLFQAYLAGRTLYNRQFNHGKPQPVCAWFDENHAVSQPCATHEQFEHAHQAFVQKRCHFLAKQPTRKMAKIVPLSLDYHHERQNQFYHNLAGQLLSQAYDFHQHHHVSHAGKTVSVGLIRMANIQPLMTLASAIHQLQTLADIKEGIKEDDTHFYLCCYHSQQVLALRNRLENRLDALLARKNVTDAEFINRDDIAHAIANTTAKHPHKTQHIFMVLATPVAEVGRDHDYDWALVEPSSMRSIIQLAGRVWRHRSQKVATTPNIGIWQYNIKALKNTKANHNGVFNRPGFESKDNPLATHDVEALIKPATLQKIDATRRIQKNPDPDPAHNLADLEQKVMADLMNNPKANVVNAYFNEAYPANRQHVHLSLLTPFRSGQDHVDYVVKPSEEGDLCIYHSDSVKNDGFEHAQTSHNDIQPYHLPTTSPLVDVWLASKLDTVLAELADNLPKLGFEEVVKQFSTLALADHQHGYYFDERFGSWRKQMK